MANQLVKSKWPIKYNMPDFGQFLEQTQHFLKKPKTWHFSQQINPIGIEVEVEGCSISSHLNCWEVREDGSLKDSGREFVSKILSGVLIDYALKELEDTFAKHKSPLNWSHRTSIHVHVNLSDMPVNKLRWLIAYYALTEPFWYSMCDEKRIGNSFCFPICTVNPQSLALGRAWPKYCGLNLGSSLYTFNTAEFRHMHGHQDFDLYIKWIKKIANFVEYIKQTQVKILKQDMERYLAIGQMDFTPFLGDHQSNIKTLVFDNAKWVAAFLHQGV